MYGHGVSEIHPVADHDSPVSPLRVPFTCGRCHQEGSPVTQQREIHQDHILENYSLSIHGEGLFKQGLTVTAVCVSCHTSHRILPHTDPESSIHPDRVAETCTQCHKADNPEHTGEFDFETAVKEIAHPIPSE